MKNTIQYVNAWVILVISGVLLGAYIFQYGRGESPCSLCLLQKSCMIGIATGEMLNLRFGIKSAHYALSYASALIGAAISLRQIALHACSAQVNDHYRLWGFGLYTWAFIVFVMVLLTINILYFFYPASTESTHQPPMSRMGKWAVGGIVMITLAQIIALYYDS